MIGDSGGGPGFGDASATIRMMGGGSTQRGESWLFDGDGRASVGSGWNSNVGVASAALSDGINIFFSYFFFPSSSENAKKRNFKFIREISFACKIF